MLWGSYVSGGLHTVLSLPMPAHSTPLASKLLGCAVLVLIVYLSQREPSPGPKMGSTSIESEQLQVKGHSIRCLMANNLPGCE